MFKYPEDLLTTYENEYEVHSPLFHFTENINDSFIDLISYEKSTQSSDLEILNIDHCSPDLPILYNYPQEPVNLLLDDFPAFQFALNPRRGSSPQNPSKKIGAKEKKEKIGTLSIQDRVKKVAKYLEKKKKRCRTNKTNYNMPKRGDKRVKTKGRFATINKK